MRTVEVLSIESAVSKSSTIVGSATRQASEQKFRVTLKTGETSTTQLLVTPARMGALIKFTGEAAVKIPEGLKIRYDPITQAILGLAEDGSVTGNS